MGDKSKIEWTDATWNPIRARNKATGGVGHYCEKVSAGCTNCYAERMQPRFKNPIAYGPQSLEQVELFLDEEVLLQPLRWKRPRMIFVGSMTDLFGHWVPDAWLDRIWAVMALCPQHTFQVVTKRPERMAEYLNARRQEQVQEAGNALRCAAPALANCPWPLSNVWLLTSVEDQATADARIPHLLQCPAVVRGLSVEPLLGPVDLKVAPLHQWPNGDFWLPNKEEPDDWKFHMHRINGIHWVIVGGESGPKARPMHPDWVRSLRDQCQASGVPFFFKQWGEWISSVDGTGPVLGRMKERSKARVMPRWTITVKGGMEYWKLGKHNSGRLLDGVEHNGMPQAVARELTTA